MYRIYAWLIALIVVLLAVWGIWSWLSPRQSVPAPANQPVATTPFAAPSLNAALEPLYSGVAWSVPKADTMQMGTTTFSGVSVSAIAATSTMNIAAATTPFERYYQQKLASDGWTADSMLAAGGPGASITGYRKGNSVIIVSFSSVFHTKPANAPEQCPCDVTLSLFSTQ